jgi:hypothetical protein
LPHFITLAKALKEIHEKKILHCDIHPENIIFRQSGEPILIDFGSVKLLGEHSVSVSTTQNARYAPLEQRGDETEPLPTWDVYGLAASLYFAVTGREPIGPVERSLTNGNDPLVPPKQENFAVSDWMNQAILQGMALRPSDRSPSMQEWLNLLQPPQVVPKVPARLPEKPKPRKIFTRRKPSFPWTSPWVSLVFLLLALLPTGFMIGVGHRTSEGSLVSVVAAAMIVAFATMVIAQKIEEDYGTINSVMVGGMIAAWTWVWTAPLVMGAGNIPMLWSWIGIVILGLMSILFFGTRNWQNLVLQISMLFTVFFALVMSVSTFTGITSMKGTWKMPEIAGTWNVFLDTLTGKIPINWIGIGTTILETVVVILVWYLGMCLLGWLTYGLIAWRLSGYDNHAAKLAAACLLVAVNFALIVNRLLFFGIVDWIGVCQLIIIFINIIVICAPFTLLISNNIFSVFGGATLGCCLVIFAMLISGEIGWIWIFLIFTAAVLAVFTGFIGEYKAAFYSGLFACCTFFAIHFFKLAMPDGVFWVGAVFCTITAAIFSAAATAETDDWDAFLSKKWFWLIPAAAPLCGSISGYFTNLGVWWGLAWGLLASMEFLTIFVILDLVYDAPKLSYRLNNTGSIAVGVFSTFGLLIGGGIGWGIRLSGFVQ